MFTFTTIDKNYISDTMYQITSPFTPSFADEFMQGEYDGSNEIGIFFEYV